ncbi:hypothetical protein ACPPVU_21150 [Mucilaginibacter sp. McL0603]|uniref:hypothetical protein n=1 Tax=Mucilaginibacter sp. McL0603 TaxID=3415670 RepID=UPI003CF8CEC0
MIKRIAITTLILLVGYTLIIHFHNNAFNAGQYSEQRNIMKAERYLYGNTDTLKGVIVGSSLTERVLVDSIRGIYNLSFGGYGPQDGLKILLMKKKIPPFVFVETNFSANRVREDFQKNFDPAFEYPEKLHIPILRSENQPVSFALGAFRSRKKAKKIIDISMNNTENNPLFTTMLSKQEDLYNHPDTNKMKKTFLELKAYVNAIEKRGSKVYFLQMPVNKALLDLPLSKAIRAAYARNFPDAKYVPIPDSLTSNFETADGIHLNEYSAWVLARYFRDYFYKLESK